VTRGLCRGARAFATDLGRVAPRSRQSWDLGELDLPLRWINLLQPRALAPWLRSKATGGCGVTISV
jgi:hypothetical protein